MHMSWIRVSWTGSVARMSRDPRRLGWIETVAAWDNGTEGCLSQRKDQILSKFMVFEVRTWTNYCKWTLPIFGRPAMPQRFSWRSNHWPLQTQTAFDSWRLYSLYTSKIGESQRSCSWQGPHIRFIGETGLEDPKWWPVDLVFGLATHTFVFERSWLPLAHSISKYWMSFQPWCDSFRTWEVAFERTVRSIHQHMGVVLKPMQDF